MFEKLKRRSLQRQTEKNLFKRDFSQRNNSLKTMGFLVDEKITKDYEDLYSFAKRLNIQTKDVKIFFFEEVKKKTPTLQQNMLSNKDFSFTGELLNQNAKEFLDIPFDVLVGYYSGKNEFLDLMVSASNSKFKVGVKGSDKRLFDLIIDIEPQQFQKFNDELKKYLKILNKI